MKFLTSIVFCTAFACCLCVQADENLNVFPEAVGESAQTGIVYQALLKRADVAFEKRKQKYESVKTSEDCVLYKNKRKEFFLKQIGGFPERTPLNAKIIKRLSGDRFRIECVTYESWPGHRVTANFYLPLSKGPYPAVLIPCGHSHDGKADPRYQRVCMLLAQNGMAALCYDPIGQGERYQILSKEPVQFFRGGRRLRPPHPNVQMYCTAEHTLASVSSIPLGSSSARFRIWDGMRSIDFLTSRPKVDKNRIGCAGNSGGGTLTSYLMALDDRVYCAAPGCYSTTFHSLLNNKGPQDGEQIIFGQLGFGMGIADYSIMHAPKPTLICAATHDSTFKIEGTWDLYRETQRFYSHMGFSERMAIIEADAPHGFGIELREATVRWMSRWLLNKDVPIEEGDLPAFNYQQLQCSVAGQIMLDGGERSVFEINEELEQNLSKSRAKLKSTLDEKSYRDEVRNVSKISKFEEISLEAAQQVGEIKRDGYTIKKMLLNPQHNIPLPALLFVPEESNNEFVLYLNGKGKDVDANEGGMIVKRVKEGQTVLAVDITCIGELSRKTDRHISWAHGLIGRNYHEFAVAYLLGDSMVKLRAEDVFVASKFLNSLSALNSKIQLVASGETAIAALHAAALEPDLFSKVKLSGMITSWKQVVKTPETHNQLINVVHGSLRVYDLPDLVELAGGVAKVTVSRPADVVVTERSP